MWMGNGFWVTVLLVTELAFQCMRISSLEPVSSDNIIQFNYFLVACIVLSFDGDLLTKLVIAGYATDHA